MNGPAHYTAAERLIDEAHTAQYDSGPGCGSEELLAEAQVHATLALAAATAIDPKTGAGISYDRVIKVREQWATACVDDEPIRDPALTEYVEDGVTSVEHPA